MDAVKFLEEKERMCNHYSDNEMSNLCPCSEKYDESNFCGADCNKMEYEKLVAIVDFWSGRHPVTTNRDKFEELFGFNFDAVKRNETCINYGRCSDVRTSKMCVRCPWWSEEYQEPKGEKNE